MEKSTESMFRVYVEQRRQELLHLANSSFNQARELVSDIPQDVADRSAMSASRELAFQQASQTRQQLRLLDLALQRMQDGSFGQCRTCGEQISVRRLKAVPWADQCLDCQRAAEQEKLSA